MVRLFCRRRLRANGELSQCEHHDAGYGKVLSVLPTCPACGLRLERPAADEEETLAILEAAIAEPVGIQTAKVGWDTVALIASERGRVQLVKRMEGLRAEHSLGPAFPWSVRADRDGLFFTRRQAMTDRKSTRLNSSHRP